MNDQYLIDKVDGLIDDFCKNGSKARLWTMHIPAQPENDPDLVFSTLLKRFKETLKENEQLKSEHKQLLEALIDLIPIVISKYNDVKIMDLLDDKNRVNRIGHLYQRIILLIEKAREKKWSEIE